MTLETFFEKFDTFADSPDAVAKMRELVLELAVRGKLLQKDSVASSDSSHPYPIPHDWNWVALDEAADCRCGTKVNPSSIKDSDWVLDLEDIDGGAGRVIANATFADRRSLSTKASFRSGDVLYGKLRPYLNKVVVADRPGFCTTEIIPLRPHSFLVAGYLRIFLRSPWFLGYAAAKNYGMKMPRLGTKDLESAPIPLPPLAEQKRIVAKVDELMALCDRLEAQQQERDTRHAELARASLARFAEAPTPANLHFLFHKSYPIPPADLRKSILTLAVQGKLVPQDANDEPAEDLAERIRVEKTRSAKTGKAAKSAEFAPITDAAKPYDIPASWAWIPLGNATLIRTGKLDANASSPDGQYPFFTCARDPLRIDRYAYDGECVLLAGNGNFDVNYYDGKFEAYQRTYIIEGVSRDMIDGRYLFRFIQKYADTLHEMSVGGVISYIKIGFLTDAPFPLPPLAEQRRIVAKVDQLMALVDELETQLAASRATAKNLLDAIVAELTAR
jgi:type I restriction enzyme S subunit